MQSWYQFGYEGFPGGERRRRFYRQRDDPCDSQEDLSNSDENDFGGLDSNSDNDDYWQPSSRRGGRSDPCGSSAYSSGHRQRTARSRRRRKTETEYGEVGGSDRPIYYYTLREESGEEEGGKAESQLQGKDQGPSEMPEWWSEDESDEHSEEEERNTLHPDDAVRIASTLEVGSSGSADLLHRPAVSRVSDSHINSRTPSSSSQNSVDQFFDEDVEDWRMPAEEGKESTVTAAVGTTHNDSSQHQNPYSHERKKSVVLGSQADVGSASTLSFTRHKVATRRHESSPLVRRTTRTMIAAPLGGEERRRVDSYLTTTTHEDSRLLSLFGSSCVSFQIPCSSTWSDCASSAGFSSKQTMCAGASVNTGMCCSTEPIESDPITLLVCYGGAPPYTANPGATTTGASNMTPFHSYLTSNTRSTDSRLTTSSSPSTPSSSAKVSSAFTIIAVSAESVAAPISVGKTTNQVSALDNWNGSPSSSSPVEGLENVAVHCRPVDTCPAATLTAVADWTRLHPGLRQTNPLLSAAGVAPARVGHCAVALPFSTQEAGYALASPSSSSVRASPLTSAVSPTPSTPTDFLAVSGSGFRVNNAEALPVGDGHHEGMVQAQEEAELSCSSSGDALHSILSTSPALASPAAAAPPYSGDRSLRAHLLLSFVFGGSSALINERHPRVGGSRLLNCRFGGKTVCMPALCVTVVVEDRRSDPSLSCRSKASFTPARSVAPPLTQHQLYFPLLSAPDAVTSGLEPLAFATMTPWPLSSSDSTANATPDDMSLRLEKGNRTSVHKRVMSFALLGGTSNGWQPASFSPVTLIHLDVATWTWSTSAWLALGAEPTPRFGHSATLAPKPVPGGGQQIVVFGGIGKNREYLNDLYVLDTTSRVWREVLCLAPLHYFPTPSQAHRSDVSTPHGRAFHAAVMLPPFHTPGGGPTTDTTTSSFSARYADDGKGAKVHEDHTRIGQLVAPAQDLPAEDLPPLDFDAYLNRFILYGPPRSSFLASDHSALPSTLSDKDKDIRRTAPERSDSSFSASGLYNELTTPTLVSTKRRPHRLPPIVFVGGEGEMGLERSVWSLELLFGQEGHIMAQWARWAFPALRWPRCYTTHRSLITTTDPRGVPRCVLPRVLDGNEQERIKSALSYRIKVETSRQRVTPSRLNRSAGGLTSCTSTCPSEDASATMDFFASCCGSLPQAVVVGYARRCSAALQAVPLTHSAPTAKSNGESPSSCSAPPVSYCMSSSSENESWANRDAGVLIFGGTSSLYSSFLTTVLTPCGKSLRAEARMKLLSMARTRESEVVGSAVEGK